MQHRISDLFHLQMGKTPSRNQLEYWENGSNKWISISDLSNCSMYTAETKEVITDCAVRETNIRLVPKNTVIMSFKLSIGKTAITSEPVYTNEAIMAFIDKGEGLVLPEFLYYQLLSKDWGLAGNRAVMGATLNKASLSQMRVYVPSLQEQQGIVQVLSHIDSQLKRTNELVNKLDDLVKSRFIEMFGNLDSKQYRPLRETCKIITDGTHQPQKFIDSGIPFLFVSNVTSNKITYGTQKYIDQETYEMLNKRTPIEIGDVLVSAVGSFGHPAIVKEDRPFAFQRHIAYLKPRQEIIDSSFLHSYLLTDEAQRYMDLQAKGVAQRTVTLKSFKEMMVPAPSLDLQKQFANFVSQVDKLRFAAQQQIDKLEMLKKSLLQEYFN